MAIRRNFVSPRSLNSFEQTQRSFQELQETLDRNFKSVYQLSLQTQDFTPLSPSFTRVSPLPGTLKCQLPAASPDNAGDAIVFNIERARGTFKVFAASQQKVNGGSTATFTTDGIVALYSNGVDSWASANQLPAESPTGAALTADVVLGVPSASFPNGRVATASVEITPSIAVANVISWALNAASVVFAKLQNLTGLSVLGRAANSAGVMAAITAGGAQQYLRSNTAGTSLEWADPASASIVNTGVTFQRAALSGAVQAALNSNVTSFGNLAALSVLANATNASAIPAALAGTAAFQHLRVNATTTALEWSVLTSGDFPAGTIPVGSLATQANDTFVGNVSGGVASPVAVALSTLAGAGLVLGTHTLDVTAGAGASIVVSANDVQRAALTGAITAAQDSNNTFFRSFSAKSVLCNATNALAVPSDMPGIAANQYLRVNAANTALEWGTLPGTLTVKEDPFAVAVGSNIDTMILDNPTQLSGTTVIPMSATSLSAGGFNDDFQFFAPIVAASSTYMGDTPWFVTFLGAASALAAVAGGSNSHPGQLKITSGSTIGNFLTINKCGIGGNPVYVSNGVYYFCAVIEAVAATQQFIFAGLSANPSTVALANTIGFYATQTTAATVWHTYTDKAGVASDFPTANAVAAGVFMRLEAILTTSNGLSTGSLARVDYYINGALVRSETNTANFPAVPLHFAISMMSNSAATRDLLIDFAALRCQRCQR